MRKIILSSVILGAVCVANAGTMPVVYPEYNTVSFTLDSHVTVKSDTALVNVEVNITTLSGNNTIVKKSALDELKKLSPKSDWKIVNYKQSESASGAINIKIDIQARLTQSKIDALRKSFTNHSTNQKMDIKVLNYNPTEATVKASKKKLMIGMYQEIQQYVKDFNTKTHSNYHIQHVSYNSNIQSYNRPAPQIMMLAKVGGANSTNNDVEVSKDINLSANVTLAMKPYAVPKSKANDKGKTLIGGKGGLPPAYLDVDGFKKCMGTKDMGGWSSYCMPTNKPYNCQLSSWDELVKMSLPHCYG